MKFSSLLALGLALGMAIPALANDQQKAQKEMNKVTAIARDLTARSMVNLSISQMFNVPRTQLVQERGETGLNYGSLFLASELMKSGMKIDDMAAQLKSGKKITDIANEHHVDWKTVTEDAKKLNSAIDNNLYRYFMAEKPKAEPAAMKTATAPVEEYDVHRDGVKADAEDVSDEDIQYAGNRYQTWKERALKAKGDNRELSLEKERIGYADHTGGPTGSGGAGGTGNTSTGTVVPGFGGPSN